jgi:hypothetical protein
MCFISLVASNSVSGDYIQWGIAISGATTTAAPAQGSSAYHQQPAAAGDYSSFSGCLMTGLTAGSTTFKVQYGIVLGGTGTFATRALAVIPL